MECYNLPIAPRPRSSKESRRSAPPSQVSSIRVGKSVVEHESIATQNALAATLVDDAPHMLHAWEGTAPPLGILLHGEAPAESRLPLR